MSVTAKPATANNAIYVTVAALVSRDNPQSNSYSAEEHEQILRAYKERSSLRGLTRTFGVARNTVSSWLRKKNS